VGVKLCMKEWFKDNQEEREIFFLDDAVEDMTFELKDNKIKCHILNIDKI